MPVWSHRASGIDSVINLSTRAVPHHTRIFGIISFSVELEIVMNTIEIGTRSSVEFRRRQRIFSVHPFDIIKNALLRNIFLFVYFFIWTRIERIVIIAVAVNIIRIEFLCSLVKLDLEISASCRIGVIFACTVVNWNDLGIYKSSVYHELVCALL